MARTGIIVQYSAGGQASASLMAWDANEDSDDRLALQEQFAEVQARESPTIECAFAVEPKRLLPTELIYSENSLSERRIAYQSLSASQMLRYEAYIRSRLIPNHVSMVMQMSLKTSRKPSPVICVLMSGICKVFLAELIRTTVEVQEERRHTGALRPLHFREAYRRMHSDWRRVRRRGQYFR